MQKILEALNEKRLEIAKQSEDLCLNASMLCSEARKIKEFNIALNKRASEKEPIVSVYVKDGSLEVNIFNMGKPPPRALRKSR